MISNNFIPPKYGDPIPLLCIKCKNMFVGPNPQGSKEFIDLFKKNKKAKCPKCGSRSVIPHPGVLW